MHLTSVVRKLPHCVFVYSKKEGCRVPFRQSIVDLLLGSTSNLQKTDKGVVTLLHNGSDMLIDADQPGTIEIPIRRSSYCPFANKNKLFNLDWSNRPDHIPVACSSLIETKENGHGLFITRRAGGLRTFPRLWVPPGGHLEPEETMENAVRRELLEEIGLGKTVIDEKLKPICAWESAFPVVSSKEGPVAPKRHHLVIYYVAKMKYNLEELKINKLLGDIEPEALDIVQNTDIKFKAPVINLKFDDKEVSAAAWLSRSQVTSLVRDALTCETVFTDTPLSELVQIGRYIRSEFRDVSMKKHRNWNKCATYPNKEEVSDLGPVWYYSRRNHQWALRNFDELYSGMISGFKPPTPSPRRVAHGEYYQPSPPSRLSVGTIFAMYRWLKTTEASLEIES